MPPLPALPVFIKFIGTQPCFSLYTLSLAVFTRQRQRTSLVAQWLRIHLPIQGTRVQALVQEDPTCRGATKPVRHNY